MPLGNNMTAFSIVESRYIYDLMDVLDDENDDSFSLRFTEGPAIISGVNNNDRLYMLKKILILRSVRLVLQLLRR